MEIGGTAVVVKSMTHPTEARLSIVGVARNCGRTIEKDVARLDAATADFAARRFHIVESDSSDDTVARLSALQAARPDFSFETLGALAPTMPLRTQRISHCRNLCLEAVRSDLGHAESSYVMVTDLDGVNNRIDRTGVMSCWSLKETWDVCTANRVGRYYDVYALRCADWNDGDCIAAFERLENVLAPSLARQVTVASKMIDIPLDHPPILVDSAFGGLAIYTRAAFFEGTYEGLSAQGEELCEHVPFHREIVAKGGRILINPRLVAGGVKEFVGKDAVRNLKDSLLAAKSILSRR